MKVTLAALLLLQTNHISAQQVEDFVNAAQNVLPNNFGQTLHEASKPVKDALEPEPAELIELYGIDDQVPVFSRSSLGKSANIKGPALITEMVATIYIESGWNCQVDRWGNLLLEKP